MMEASGGSIDALTDDNLADILVRLDAVSVLRCRAVCKSWRRITTGRSFLATHAAGRPREIIIKTKYGYERSTVPICPTDDDLDTTTAAGGGGDDDGGLRHHRYLFDTHRTPADGDGMSSRFVLIASLDGLLVLKHWRSGGPPSTDSFTYVICNPVTRQWTNLPSPVPRRRSDCDFRSAIACGFYLHASSGEYRLLLHCAVKDLPGGSGWERYCCVVSVGSTLPRRLPHAPPTERLVLYYEDPVSHRGTLHWLSGHPEGSSTGKMLAFDTASETFRLMPRPPEGPEPTTDGAMSDLLELDGELSVATLYGNGTGTTTLDIWALQDYEAEKWTLRHRLKAKVRRPPRSIIMAMGNALHASSAILVGFPFSPRAVMVYSLKDNKAVDRKIDFGGFVSFRVFRESLVPHAFFDSPETVPLNFSHPLFK